MMNNTIVSKALPYTACGEYVLVRPQEVKSTSIHLLPGTQKAMRESAPTLEGVVVSVGDNCPLVLAAGQRVLYGEALPIDVDGEALDLVKANAVVVAWRSA